MIFLKNCTHCTRPNDAPGHSKWINILKNIVRSLQGKKSEYYQQWFRALVVFLPLSLKHGPDFYHFNNNHDTQVAEAAEIKVHTNKEHLSHFIGIDELIKLAKFNFPAKKSELFFSLYPDFNGIFNVFFQS